MHKIHALHIWHGTFLHLQIENSIFPKQKGCYLQIYSTALSHWWLQALYLTWNAKHFLPRPEVKSFWKVYTDIFWVFFVLLHTFEKQSQAFVRGVCVCVFSGISCILFSLHLSEGYFMYTFSNAHYYEF